MTAPYALTRRALFDLQDIYEYSLENWGERRALDYIDVLYKAFEQTAVTSHASRLSARSAPFLMAQAGSHLIIYDMVPEGLIVLTIVHQMRNLEAVIAAMDNDLAEAIEAARASLKS